MAATARAASGDHARKPHWLFVLSQTDHEAQAMFEAPRFVDIVAAKLLETLAADRHPILFGPREFTDRLVARMPTTSGVDILPFCSFTRFMSLVTSAECAFYWNAVSHSILIRLFNGLPVVLFDRGHLVRNVPTMYDRVVEWYYQGEEPPFVDHRQPLTFGIVSQWIRDGQRVAARMQQGFRRAPTPAQMVDGLRARP